MSDVFISYAREDARAAKKLADMLSGQGYTVFWDRRIEPGTPWEDTIERESGHHLLCRHRDDPAEASGIP